MKSVNDFVRNILKNAVSSELCNTVDIHYNYYYKAVVLILARHSWAVCISANISSLSLLRLFSASETTPSCSEGTGRRQQRRVPSLSGPFPILRQVADCSSWVSC